MRIPSGKTDQLIYFVALDVNNQAVRKTALTTFTVYRSRNGGAATAYTTPTVAELDAVNMPGLYSLAIDEDTTIASGSDAEEYVVHITQASMAPVTRAIELFRRDTTTGKTIVVDSAGLADANVVKLGPTGTGTAQTARDVGATLGVAGAGLTALGDTRIANLDATVTSRMATFTLPTNFSAFAIDTSGRVNAFLVGILTSVFTEGATSRIADAFKKFFNVASATGTVNSLPDAVPDASGGLPVTGTRLTAIPTLPAALVGGRIDASVGAVASAAISAAAFASGALDAVWSTATRVLTAATNLTTALATPTNITAGTITTVTNLTNAPTAGDFTATMKAATLARVTLVDTVTTYTGNTPQTGDAFARVGAAGAGLTALGDTRVANLDATISSRTKPADTQARVTLVDTTTTLTNAPADSAGVGTLLTQLAALIATVGTAGAGLTAVTTQVWAAGTRTLSSFGTLVADTITAIGVAFGIGSYLRNTEPDNTNIGIAAAAAASAATNAALLQARVPASPAAVGSAMTLTSGERDSIAAAQLDLANGIEVGLTERQAFRLMAAALAGKISGAATTTITIRNAVADSKDRIVATVDSDGDRTALTVDVS